MPGNTQSEASTSTAAPDESNTAIFAAAEGTWRLDGEGGFIAYYASGSVEASGYLEYVDEYGDGIGQCVDLIGEFEYRDLEIEEATQDS